MMKEMKLVALASLLVFSSAFCFAQDLPDGKGKDLVTNVCGACHGLDVVTAQGATKDGWTSIIQEMVSRGAQATDTEIDTMSTYLAKNFPPPPPAAGGASSAGTASAGAPSGGNTSSAAPADTAKVHVNKATAQDLQTALSLTPDEAAAIVKYRMDNGDFKDMAGLLKVTGVDPAKLEAKKDSIVFD